MLPFLQRKAPFGILLLVVLFGKKSIVKRKKSDRCLSSHSRGVPTAVVVAGVRVEERCWCCLAVWWCVVLEPQSM